MFELVCQQNQSQRIEHIMSSQRTWERRTLAGLLEKTRDDGLNLIEGLTVRDDGTFVFMHEELTASEAARVERSAEALRTRLEGLFTRLGGGSARADDEDGIDADDDLAAEGSAVPDPADADDADAAADTDAGAAADEDEDAAGGSGDDSGAFVLDDGEYVSAEAGHAASREPVGAGV